MQHRQRRRSRKLYQRFWLYCLMLLLIVTTAVAVIGYFMLLGFTRDEAEQTNRHKLELAQGAIDSQLMVLQNIAVNLASDTDLTDGAVLRDVSGLQTSEALNRYRYSIDILENLIVYYHSALETRVFTPGSIYRQRYFDSIFQHTGLTVARMAEWSGTVTAPTFMRPDEDNAMPEYLVYAFPVSSGGIHRNRTIFFLLNTDRIYRALADALDGAPATIRILRSDGAVLYQRDTRTIGDGGRTLYTAAATYAGLRLQMEIAPLAGFARMQASWFRLMACIAALGVAGMLLSLVLSRRFSRPIVNLANRLGEGEPADAAPATPYAELYNIEQSYRRLSLEKDRMATQLQTQSSILRSNLLFSMLHGKLEAVDDAYLHDTMGLHRAHTVYAMVYVMIDRLKAYRALFTPMAQDDLESELLDRFHALEALDASVAITSFLPGKTAVVLAATTPGLSREALLCALQDVQREIKAAMGISVSLVCGSQFDALGDMDEQYRALAQYAQHRIFSGWGSLLDMENAIEYVEAGEPVEPAALYNACAAADEAEALQLTRRMLRQGLTEASGVAFKRAYFTLLGVIKGIAEERKRGDLIEIDAAYEPETLAEADEYLATLIRSICACVQMERTDKHATLCQAVQDYLEEAYAEDACCPAQVAEHFHMAQPQLNRIYKQHYGIGLASALDATRMRHAKARLVGTAQTIKDIVSDVGYGDVNNFIRKFKKQEGMTPLTYRKKMAMTADIQALEE